jgi:hypothetical protein
VVAGIDWATQTGGVAYNLTVADLHTYFVVAGDSNVLVHNSCRPNLGNLKRLSDKQIEDNFGMTAHEFKHAVLGERARISRYDIYREGDNIYLVEKSTNKVIDTGYNLSVLSP